MTASLASARRLADDVLFPAAGEVDRTGRVPESHFERLAHEGFYGLAAPAEAGGPGLEFAEVLRVLETLAGGCLATTFTWIQHHGVVLGLVGTPNTALRERYLAAAVRGDLRCGVAFAGVVPTPPRMRATRRPGGWRLSGQAPFVSGWGCIDLVQVSAVDDESGDVLGALLAAEQCAGLTASPPLDLVAAQATSTVSLTVRDLDVPDDRIVGRTPRPAFLAGQVFGSRINGSLPLGLVQRSATLLDEAGAPDAATRLRTACDAVRAALDAGLADPASMPAARARGSELAVRATSALVAAVGSASVLRAGDAQRLAREAVFTLVAASRPEMREDLVRRLVG
ncbi:acyl-CoA dehydrogenase family protein [Pseudonocardia lacus]|uniref:acyl-CoA dehydrogenase family protein n=1 Tax=Pseudonocardia lacus TaxID=2835865 RepID=UPI001BDCFF1F|nr:acyl-CoA dehydrogenase family protein [Pseudonocardia lacus]